MLQEIRQLAGSGKKQCETALVYSHRYQGKRDSNRHAHDAPNKPLLMQSLPFRRKSLKNTLGLARRYHRARKAQIHLCAMNLLITTSRRQRRHRLETPFLVGDAPKSIVSIVDDLSLPALVHLLPLRPSPGGPGGALVNVGATLWRSGDFESFRVEQRSPRGER